jgi:site-specific DNA-cytosine methylase
MRELSLFSGTGGGLLATKHLLGWTTVGYVEIDDYCQRVIAQRIRDGLLDDAPIFGDIRAFIREGYAASYQGMVDVVTAGFPCQPFSLAGRRLGDADERDMWPAAMDCIRVVRPRFCLLENSPGLLIRGMGRVLGDLAESGYDATYDCIPAAAVGAPHFRDRVLSLQPPHRYTTPVATLRGTTRDTRKRKGGGCRTLESDLAELGERGPVNPEWLEWLMGFPIGWTENAPQDKDKFRQWLRLHGGCSAEK